MFGPWAQTSVKSEDIPPFYISLRIHDMFLHNAMFDSGASHNLMPKIVMENRGHAITKHYKDLYSFDSREVKFVGLIKDLVVSLHQILEKSLVMDTDMGSSMLFNDEYSHKSEPGPSNSGSNESD